MCFLSTTFPNAPAHPPPPILFDQSLIIIIKRTVGEAKKKWKDLLAKA